MSEYNANIRLSESREEAKMDLKRDAIRKANAETFERERAIKELKWQSFIKYLTALFFLVILSILFFTFIKYT